MLRFDWITDGRDVDSLETDWRALDDAVSPGAVFRSFEWQSTWWRLLGEDARRGRELRLLVGRDLDGRARGILPLYVEDAPLWPIAPVASIRRRRASLLADGVVGSDYLGLIARDVDHATLAPLFAKRVATDPLLHDVELVELTDLLAGDRFGDALARELCGAGYAEVERVRRYRCPFADLAPGRDRYLATRPDHFGIQVGKRRRELERMGGFGLTIATTPAEIARSLGTLFALHRLRWAAEGGSQAIDCDRVELFHREAGRAIAARGWARLCVMSVRGEAVAAGYGFARAGRFAYYQAGLDPDWRKRSAGTVLLGELIDRAFAEGLTEFDFLRGEEPYKKIWADRVRETVVLRAVRPTARARLLAGAARAIGAMKLAARRTLPDAVVAKLRRWVHR